MAVIVFHETGAAIEVLCSDFFYFNDSLIKIRLRGWCSGKESPANAGATGVRTLDWEDPLEWAVGTCSSILAWKTPQTEEPGRLQSM